MIRGRQRGFTLLEVLVAFTILALIFGALFEVFAGGLTAARQGESYTRAILLAQSKLAEVTASDEFAIGEQSGFFDVNARLQDGPRFLWRVELVHYEGDELGPTRRAPVQPYKLSVTVTWDDVGREQRVSLESMVLKSR